MFGKLQNQKVCRGRKERGEGKEGKGAGRRLEGVDERKMGGGKSLTNRNNENFSLFPATVKSFD